MSDTIEHSSKNTCFRTPPEFLDIIREFDEIALDPCAPIDNNTGAKRFYTESDDGLTRPWADDGLTFFNPPYGRMMRFWANKATYEHWQHRESLGLLPARLGSTMWQHTIRQSASAICVLAGRLTFWDFHPETGVLGPAVSWSKKHQRYEVTPAGFDSGVVYWGKRVDRFEGVFERHGMVFRI